jgi:molybdate/tungstate transport system ATP-binding protein
LIELKVKKRFGDFILDAEVSDEKFICLSGKNGSGKSTLLKIISGQMRPDAGVVKLDSKDITGIPAEKRGVVLVTPDSCIPHLDVKNHLLWGTKLKGNTPDVSYLNQVRKSLGITYDGKVARLSLGMRERVSLATALLSNPEVILIDEAFANIDNRMEFISTFRTLTNKAGIDVVFSTQDPHDSSLADHHYNIEAGKSTKIF